MFESETKRQAISGRHIIARPDSAGVHLCGNGLRRNGRAGSAVGPRLAFRFAVYDWYRELYPVFR